MSGNYPFQAITSQFCVDASNAASAPVRILPPAGGATSFGDYYIANNGTGVVQFVLTPTATAATLTASGSSGAGFTLLPNTQRVFAGPPQAWFSCITATGTSQMCVVGGDGI